VDLLANPALEYRPRSRPRRAYSAGFSADFSPSTKDLAVRATPLARAPSDRPQVVRLTSPFRPDPRGRRRATSRAGERRKRAHRIEHRGPQLVRGTAPGPVMAPVRPRRATFVPQRKEFRRIGADGLVPEKPVWPARLCIGPGQRIGPDRIPKL